MAANKCLVCSVKLKTKHYRKCDACFEKGKRGLRQSGRTTAVIKTLSCGDLFIVPWQHYAKNLTDTYPWLKDNITTPTDLVSKLLGDRRFSRMMFDHTMTEFCPEAAERCYAAFAMYRGIDPKIRSK